MNYETSEEIEIAVADWFGIRTYIIVPNVSWGIGIAFECDLAVLSSSGYLYEIEIKVSRSDLIRDKGKRKWTYHEGYKIRKLWFAIPEALLDSIEHIPDKAGVFVVDRSGKVSQVRRPQIDRYAAKLSYKDQFALARLGAMRIWGLKRAMIQRKSIAA